MSENEQDGTGKPGKPDIPATVAAAVQAVDDMRAELQKAVRAARRRRLWGLVLSAVVVVLVAACATLGVVVAKGRALTDTVRNGAITSCQDGNEARATSVTLWDEFFTALITDPQLAVTRTKLEGDIAALGLPAAETQGLDDIIVANWTANPAEVKVVEGLEAYVAAREKQQPCGSLYGADGNG